MALHLPGGGARGAYQVGAMRAIGELNPKPERCPFPIFTGTSAGAINAAVLASHADRFSHGVDRLSMFWSAMRCHNVYRTDWLSVIRSAGHWLGAVLFGRLGLRAPAALLDTTPLHRLLKHETRLERIAGLISAGALDSLAVSASGYATGRAVTFFQSRDDAPWHRGRRRGRSDVIDVDHLMASTALPLLFPPARIGHEYFGDGSLRQTAPLSPAIHLGADRILIVTARDARQDPEPAADSLTPSAGEIAGHLLDIVFMDNLDADLERLHRINQTLALIPEPHREKSDLRPIETLVIRPSRDLRELVAEHVSLMPASVKTMLAGVGAWRSDHRLASYLLFEASYCRALMDLGYQDAMRDAEKIERLLFR
ncbi:MAG: patatin-like phospholipase family protein [Pseudomonadota bacterium]